LKPNPCSNFYEWDGSSGLLFAQAAQRWTGRFVPKNIQQLGLILLNDQTSIPVYMSMSSTMNIQGGSAGESIKANHANFCNILQQRSCALMLFDAESGEIQNLQRANIK